MALSPTRDVTRLSVPAVAGADETPFDRVIIFVVGALMALGAVMAYSAVVGVEGARFDWAQWWRTPLRQCFFAAAGFATMLLVASFDYRMLRWDERAGLWRSTSLLVLALLLVALLYAPGIGREQLGATRSLPLIPGMLTFQPPEVAKLSLVIWLAAVLSSPLFDVRRTIRPPWWVAWLISRPLLVTRAAGRRAHQAIRRRVYEGRWVPLGFAFVAVPTGLLVAMVAIEDLGTGALLGVVLLIMLIVGGARWRDLAMIVPLGLAAGALFIVMKPYRWARLVSFFSPEATSTGDERYQITQALLAIGSGGWFGRGLGASVQNSYLPQSHNDFIFAIICEELGVVGGGVVVLLFLLLLWRGWWVARRAADTFGRLLAIGLTLTICLQAAFNIGVVTEAVPTKGISLPFVSAGGSGVIFLGGAAGLLASVGGRRELISRGPTGAGG